MVLLEQGQLSCGTTWHAAGLVGQLRASESGTRLVQYSTALYAELEAETGLSAGYKRCGGVTVARTEDRMTQLRRTAASAAAYDLDCELLGPDQAFERYPVMRVDDLVGRSGCPPTARSTDRPDDGVGQGRPAAQRQVFERVRVLDVLTDGTAVTGVRTDAGDIEAGSWSTAPGSGPGDRRAGRRQRAAVLGRALLRRHRGIAGVHPDLPILRDPDGYTCFKERSAAW